MRRASIAEKNKQQTSHCFQACGNLFKLSCYMLGIQTENISNKKSQLALYSFAFLCPGFVDSCLWKKKWKQKHGKNTHHLTSLVWYRLDSQSDSFLSLTASGTNSTYWIGSVGSSLIRHDWSQTLRKNKYKTITCPQDSLTMSCIIKL